jgi:hypothetical protein
MQEKMYYLMHRDDPVCMVSIDPISGAMLRVSQKKVPELLPLGGKIDTEMLRRWWQRRAVPMSQGKIQRILEQMGITTPQEYLVKNLGLSLTDHYWIKPLDMDLGWSDINLFTNDFRDPVGDMQFDEQADPMELPENAFSPSSSVQGELRKKWIIMDGKRCLVKGNHGSNSQESLNEVVATLLHKKQARQPYVTYNTMRLDGNSQIYCVCESFTSDEVELIPAIDVVDSKKKDNATSVYEHFIQVCSEHGMDEGITRPFLEYQIMTDFVLTNTDRHLNNFGVLRDTKTLKFIGMAPIFDSGNSMFWQNPKAGENADFFEITVNSFARKEIDLWKYVKSPHLNILDRNLFPSEQEIYDIYAMDPMIPSVDSIVESYKRKVHFISPQ